MSKPPEGWTFLDWKDNLGITWKDCIPTPVVDIMRHDANYHIIKEVRG